MIVCVCFCVCFLYTSGSRTLFKTEGKHKARCQRFFLSQSSSWRGGRGWSHRPCGVEKKTMDLSVEIAAAAPLPRCCPLLLPSCQRLLTLTKRSGAAPEAAARGARFQGSRCWFRGSRRTFFFRATSLFLSYPKILNITRRTMADDKLVTQSYMETTSCCTHRISYHCIDY